jgi:methionine-gamma-lyase
MRAHQENAMRLADYLEDHPQVLRVIYPGLASHPQSELANRQMRNFSGMISFQTKNGEGVARRMMKDLRVIHYAVSLGHHRSLIYWLETQSLMESTFGLQGRNLSRYRDFAGDGIFRFSVGLETFTDIARDLDRVLRD